MQRLYREERLMVRRRGGRKRAIGSRRPMVTPLAADQRWSLDFVSDQLTDGRRFRILAVVDDCTRECLALRATAGGGGLDPIASDDVVLSSGRRPAPTVFSVVSFTSCSLNSPWRSVAERLVRMDIIMLEPEIDLAQDTGGIGANGDARIIALDGFDKGFGHAV